MTFKKGLGTLPQKPAGKCISQLFKLFSKDSISKNALILVSTWFMNAAVGFIFILIAARLYPIDAVGIAMLLLAYSNFTVLISRFGIQQSMIRFYSESEKSEIFCSSVLATTIPAIVIGCFLIILSYFGFLGDDVLSDYSFILIFGIAFLSVGEVSGFFFLADGKPHLYLYQSVIIAIRLILLILLVSFGILGIYSSIILAVGLSVVFSLLMVHHLGVRILVIGKKFLKESFHFSLGNYLSDIFQTAPIYILPMMVFALFGERETAIYSVGYAFASIAFLIPTAIGYASFISGCRNDSGMASIEKRIIPVLLLLIGIILGFYFWGKNILSILGPDYAGTSDLVVTIMSASVFALFFQLYSAEFKIQRQVMQLILINCIFFIALICLSIFFMFFFGLLGAGYAWIVTYALCVLILRGFLYKNPTKT